MTNIQRKTFPAVQSDSKEWLASPHGTEPNAMPSITVDTALFPAGSKTNGYIKSGAILGKVTATGLYGPYDTAAVDGRATPVGILFQAIDTHNGDQHFGTAMLVHGYVFGGKLPVAPTAGVKTGLPLIYFYA